MAQQRRRRGNVPAQTRRLTRDEAAKLGVSYGAKRRVKLGVKVTRKTRLYTDREVAQAKIGQTKELYTRERVQVVERKSGGTSRHFNNLHKAQLFKILRANRDRPVTLRLYGPRHGSRYDGTAGWTSGPETDAETLLDDFAAYLDETSVEDPTLFGLTVK